MIWHPFNALHGQSQALPPERRYVLLQMPRRGNRPPSVVVGSLKYSSGQGNPYFATPGLGLMGHPVAWCDCLGDDFHAPLWEMKQPKEDGKGVIPVGGFAQLLVRYIRHVRESEGVDFISCGGQCGDLEKAFTAGEVLLLERLAELSKEKSPEGLPKKIGDRT